MNKILSCMDTNLEDLYCNVPSFIKTFPEYVHIKDSNNFNFIATNKKHLHFFGLESSEDLKGKTVFDMQKRAPDKLPPGYPEKIQREEEKVLKTEKSVLFKGIVLNNDGYLLSYSSLKMPLLDFNNKIKAILGLTFDLTKFEDIKSLFNKYCELYKNNHQLCNQKFLEYIGISQKDYPLTTRELECLINLSEYKNLKNAAKELTISPKTLETHLHNVKLKLNVSDISTILKYFMSNKYRKF